MMIIINNQKKERVNSLVLSSIAYSGVVALLIACNIHQPGAEAIRFGRSSFRSTANSSTSTSSTTTTTTKAAVVLAEASTNNNQTTTTRNSNNATISDRKLQQDNGDKVRASPVVAPMWPGAEQDGDTRVPFWNIAHMINSPNEIEPVIRAGSNGIEVDISFNKSGFPSETYHGFPCDCGRHCHKREKFTTFVKYVAKLTMPPSTLNLQLILFDLKLKGMQQDQKREAGRHLATILDEHLYRRYIELVRTNLSSGGNREVINRPPIRVIVSINHVEDNILIRSFMEYLRQKKLDFMSHYVGFDIGMNDDLKNITSMWDQLNGLTFNVWQGDGLTNCANIVRGIERLKEAISIRNQQGHFRKIYYWTADVMYHIRSVLRLGLDAILTNQPQRVIQVLNEPEFKSKFRLATPFDDPFAQFWIKPSKWKMSVPTIGEAVETVTNIRRTSSNFVRTLPDGIAAALKKVQSTLVDRIRRR